MGAPVAQALVPAVSRLVSTRFAGVTRCRTKSVPMSGDAAGMSACATSCPTDGCEKCTFIHAAKAGEDVGRGLAQRAPHPPHKCWLPLLLLPVMLDRKSAVK